MRKIVKFFIQPFWHFRFTPSFRTFRNFFSYSPLEDVLLKIMDFADVSKIEGDYLEFGMAWGNSFVTAYHISQLYGLKNMKFYGFDSFQGLPEIKGVDAEGFRAFEKGQFSYGMNIIKRNIRKKGMDMEKMQLIPGFYGQSLNQDLKKKLPIKRASVVMIDCDLYESTVPVLEFITDYICDGTVIIFDDWFCYRANPDRGEQKAFREWLQKNPSLTVTEYQRYSMGGNSFIIHKSS